MKITLTACFAMLLVPALAAAPTDLAIVAAMKLSDAPNYSWSTNVDDDARSYAIDGQTNLATKDDLSHVSMPMVAAVRRRVTRATGNSDNQMNAIFSGDEKLVIETPDGWRKPEQLAANSDSSSNYSRGGGWGGGGFGGRRGRRGMMGGMGGGYPGPSGGDGENNGRPAPAYSNLQLTLSRPHEELGIIVAGYTDLKAEDDVVSGTLTETAAKLLLVHPGQKEITPLKASGTFRLWVKDRVLTKYEVKLEGTLAVMANGDRHEVTVHQTATTDLKDVGTTKFDVPDEAKKKLGLAVDTPPATTPPAPAVAPAPVPPAKPAPAVKPTSA